MMKSTELTRGVDLSTPLTYCDRVQLRPPGDKHFALAPHVDGGGVERWEDKAYNHVYRDIFRGEVSFHPRLICPRLIFKVEEI